MKPMITYILLLVVLCLWYQVQTTEVTTKCPQWLTRKCKKDPAKCPPWLIHACAGGMKRSDIDDDLAQEVDLRADGERPDIQEASGGETREDGQREGEKRSDGYRDSREGDDDLRSDFNDLRRQLSDERQLVDIGNHRRGHSPRSAQLDSAIGRLRSLLGRTTDLDVDDRGEAEEEGKREKREEEEEEKQGSEEEPPERISIDTDRSCSNNEAQTLLNKILSDIESRFDTQPATNSVSKN